MTKTLTLIFSFICLSANVLLAQSETNLKYFWVSFDGVKSQQHQVENPEAFLSEQALERRERYAIPVTTKDLPVQKEYLHL